MEKMREEKERLQETKSSGQAKGRKQSDVETNMKRVCGVLRKKYLKHSRFYLLIMKKD